MEKKELIEKIKESGGFVHPISIINGENEFEFPIHLSKNTEIHGGCKIGRFSFINAGTVVYAKTKIGRYCSIARNCEIGVSSHPVDWLSSSNFQYNNSLFPALAAINIKKLNFVNQQELSIGNDVWIGAKVIVHNGVQIGDGAIIAAGAVVTKDVPPYAIYGGVPAKLIRFRFNTDVVSRLLELQWWNFEIKQLNNIQFNDINLAIKQLRELKKNASK